MTNKQKRIHAELEGVRAVNPHGVLDTDEAIEYARTHPESELHGQLEWDNNEAAHHWRRHEMSRVIRAVYTTERPGGPRVHAYWSPPSYRTEHGGYVTLAAVRSDDAIAMEIARDMLRTIKAAHEDLLVSSRRFPRILLAAAHAIGDAVRVLERAIAESEEPPPRRRGRHDDDNHPPPPS
jgi:hypothetical protein